MGPADEAPDRRGAAPEEHLRHRLRWILLARLLAVSALLLALALLQYARSPLRLERSLPFLQTLGGATYAATLLYALALWRGWHPRAIAGVSLAGDVALVTALLYVTGGIDSGFSFLYLPGILVGAVLFYREGLRRRDGRLGAMACAPAGLDPSGALREPGLARARRGGAGFSSTGRSRLRALCGYLAERGATARGCAEEGDLRRLQG
jgi:two-component system sensor histidine kinase PilS (NtrC family)